MRRYSFIFAILGIFILFLWYVNEDYVFVEKEEDLEGLSVNEKVYFISNVSEITGFGEENRFFFDNGLSAVCDCYFQGIGVEIYGKIEEIEGERFVRIHKIVILE